MDASFLQIFEKRLKELRESQGLTLQNLADKTGINRVTLTNYERGERHPDERALTILARHFGVSLDYLVGISDVKSYDADIHSVCQFTGLSEKAVKLLRALNDPDRQKDSEIPKAVFSDMIETINTILTDSFLLYAINDYIQYNGLDHVEFLEDNDILDALSMQRKLGAITKSGYMIEFNDEIVKAGLMDKIQKELDRVKSS